MISMRGHRRSKMKIISFITPISQGNNKSDENLLSPEYGRIMKCHTQDSDAVELDATVEGAVCELTNLEKNMQVYDIQLTALGNYTGHGLSLASLTSTSTGNYIKGYPITVDVLEDCSAASIDDHIPAIRSLEHQLASRVSFPQKERSPRSKPGGHKKIDEHNLDQSKRAHAKKPAPDALPRKMQKLSSSASSRTEQLHWEEGIEEEEKKRDEEDEVEEDEEEDPPLHYAAESASGWARESSKKKPVVEKGSLLLTRSRQPVSCKPVVAKTKGSLPPPCSPLGADNSTSEYHLRPTAIFFWLLWPNFVLATGADLHWEPRWLHFSVFVFHLSSRSCAFDLVLLCIEQPGILCILGWRNMDDRYGISTGLQGTVKVANLSYFDHFLWQTRDAHCCLSMLISA
ncbi:unnamed protein product [Urochloa humidicola]